MKYLFSKKITFFFIICVSLVIFFYFSYNLINYMRAKHILKNMKILLANFTAAKVHLFCS